MAMPEGTSKIIYNVSQYGQNGGPDVAVEAAFTITANDFTSVDTAATTAMDAFIAELESKSPSAVTASRHYECSQAGDAWPV